MFSSLGILNLILFSGVGFGIAWVVIYSAVRAALTSHRTALARDRGVGPAGGVGPQ